MNVIRTCVRVALKERCKSRRSRASIAMLSLIAVVEVGHAGSLSQPARAPAFHASSAKRGPVTLEEITVTGTHIRGAPPESVPLIELTREQIAESGYPTIQDLIRSIPQNFGGLGSGTVETPQDSNTENFGFGTDVDLRGLGFDSTLVLVNGHRLAPGGVAGGFSDISLIPLDAIQRIDVLTAGASAIYGSDAVGGVVNFILNRHQKGAETTLGYGGVTRGGLRDYRASQSWGGDWGTGSGLISYEYHDETPLASRDRSFSSRPSSPSDLLPGWRQNAIFGTIRQDVRNDLVLTADALFADRNDNSTVIAAPERAGTTQYQANVGAEWTISDSWSATVSAGYGGNHTKSQTLNATGGVKSAGDAQNRLLTLDLSADGTVAELTAGPLRAAIGGQAREEKLSQGFSGIDSFIVPVNRGRTVEALFGELSVPLLGPRRTTGESGTPVLSADLAARYDHYSDFGSSLNPQIGIAWRPIDSLRVRGSWASSYAAPKLFELYGPDYAYLLNSADPQSPTGESPALVLGGANSKLKAEKSRQWTAGLDFSPESIPGLQLHTTYYRISYRERITSPPFLSVFAVLDSGSDFNAFIQRNPPASEVSELAGPPSIFFNETIYPGLGPVRSLGDVAAVVTATLQNVATTKTDGVDFAAEYSRDWSGYRPSVGMDATYVFHFRETPLAGAPGVSLLDTLYNPVNFRARAVAGLSRGSAAIGMAVNFANHYSDTSVPAVPVTIGSWTTIDVHARYQLEAGPSVPSILRNLEFALNCTNCADRDPPRVDTPLDALHRGYDPTNANPLGRFVSLTLTSRW